MIKLGFYGFTLYILTKLCVETRIQHLITHKIPIFERKMSKNTLKWSKIVDSDQKLQFWTIFELVLGQKIDRSSNFRVYFRFKMLLDCLISLNGV